MRVECSIECSVEWRVQVRMAKGGEAAALVLALLVRHAKLPEAVDLVGKVRSASLDHIGHTYTGHTYICHTYTGP